MTPDPKTTEAMKRCDCVFTLTDRDLPPIARTESNLWKAKFFEAWKELSKANKGLRRLRAKLDRNTRPPDLERDAEAGAEQSQKGGDDLCRTIHCAATPVIDTGGPAEGRPVPNVRSDAPIDVQSVDEGQDPWTGNNDIMELVETLMEIEMRCPCGARPESLNTHSHVMGCPVEKALQLATKLQFASTAGAGILERLAKAALRRLLESEDASFKQQLAAVTAERDRARADIAELVEKVDCHPAFLFATIDDLIEAANRIPDADRLRQSESNSRELRASLTAAQSEIAALRKELAELKGAK